MNRDLYNLQITFQTDLPTWSLLSDEQLDRIVAGIEAQVLKFTVLAEQIAADVTAAEKQIVTARVD